MKVKLINYSKFCSEDDKEKNLLDLIAFCARVSNPANQNNTETNEKLIHYLIKNNHWSPFEMVSICIEIETTRDIIRQILRHRSFSFQEFSQRYAVADLGFVCKEARLQDSKNRQNSISIPVSIPVSIPCLTRSDNTVSIPVSIPCLTRSDNTISVPVSIPCLTRSDNTISIPTSIPVSIPTSMIQSDKKDLKQEWLDKQEKVLELVQESYDWALSNGIAKEQARAVLPEGMTLSRIYMNGTLRSWIHYIQLRSGNGTQKEHRDVAVACAALIDEFFPISKILELNH